MKYPAHILVHTVSGPEPCCIRHARELEALMSFMGGHTNNTELLEPAECQNCINEANKL